MCGLPRCPVMARFHARLPLAPKKEYQGASPSVFIGSRGYPAMRGGPLLIDQPDIPPEWLAGGMGIEEIVAMRARTIRGLSTPGNDTEKIQEIALSSIPVDVEVGFCKPVSFDLSFDGIIAPVGMTGAISSLLVTGSARVERPVDRVSSDYDLGAGNACSILHTSGIDVYHITRLLSAGLLGKKRRMVPTRWAITAVDNSVSADLSKRIRNYPNLGEIEVFCAELFGNKIAFLLFPGDWRFEMIEIWGKNSLWGRDGECIVTDGEGKKKTGYSPITGAYYSARLAVAEYLHKIRRCARIVVIRSISSEYWAPLGTWVVREAARSAVRSTPGRPGSLEGAVAAASLHLGSSAWLAHSRLIPRIKSQKTLMDFQ
ncbi:MAG TPA: hypothetical protein VMW63_03325 [Methanoregulaceae archaeon]|nr:hypothetical protein [Methanoregulaceae archaeon]